MVSEREFHRLIVRDFKAKLAPECKKGSKVILDDFLSKVFSQTFAVTLDQKTPHQASLKIWTNLPWYLMQNSAHCCDILIWQEKTYFMLK